MSSTGASALYGLPAMMPRPVWLMEVREEEEGEDEEEEEEEVEERCVWCVCVCVCDVCVCVDSIGVCLCDVCVYIYIYLHLVATKELERARMTSCLATSPATPPLQVSLQTASSAS